MRRCTVIRGPHPLSVRLSPRFRLVRASSRQQGYDRSQLADPVNGPDWQHKLHQIQDTDLVIRLSGRYLGRRSVPSRSGEISQRDRLRSRRVPENSKLNRSILAFPSVNRRVDASMTALLLKHPSSMPHSLEATNGPS